MAITPSYIDSRPFRPGVFRFPNWQPRREMLRNSQATQAEEHKGVNSTIARLKEDLESTKRNYEEQVGVPRWSCSPPPYCNCCPGCIIGLRGVIERNPPVMNLWGPYMGGVPGCIFGLTAGLPPCLSGLTAEHNDGAHHGDERQAAAKGRRGRPGDIQIQDQVSGLPHAATRCGASRGSAQLFLNTEPQNTFGTSLLTRCFPFAQQPDAFWANNRNRPSCSSKVTAKVERGDCRP